MKTSRDQRKQNQRKTWPSKKGSKRLRRTREGDYKDSVHFRKKKKKKEIKKEWSKWWRSKETLAVKRTLP